MTEAVVFSGAWVTPGTEGLPAASRAAMAREDRAAAREAAELEAARADALESQAWQAERDGRDVTLQGAFDRAQRSAARTDRQAAKADLAAKVESGEVELLGGAVQRAENRHPGTDYEVESQLARAEAMHRDLVAYRARASYPAAERAARAKAGRGHVTRSRDSMHQDRDGYFAPEITRGCDMDGTVTWG